MRYFVLVLAALALAVLACNIMPGPTTPTPIPTVYTPPPTETETPEPPTPTLIPRSTIPVIELPPTSTAVRLGPRPSGNGSGNPAIGATPVTLDNGGVFIGTSLDIAGSSLQLPGGTGPIPLDFDIKDGGHKAVISGTGNMSIDGVAYNANGKQAGKRFTLARWSPDGRWLAYVVETPNAESGTLGAGATIDDGLWLLDSASNAPPEFLYRHHYGGGQDTDVRIVTDINWAWDNDAMMLTVKQPRGIGMILVGKSVRANDHNPGLFDLLLYTGGTWLPDSTQGMVTTTTADNRATVMGILHRDVGQFTPIADGGALGLYIQSPTQLPDGRYAFLAKSAPPGQAQNSGLALYVMSPGGQPQPVSQPLPGILLGATWGPSRSALLVTLGVGSEFQTKVITLDGAITDYTAQARGSASAHWGK